MTMTAQEAEAAEPQAMPEGLREAFATIAGYGPGSAAVTVDLADGRAIMVETTMHDITGWEQER